ncbi:MAG: hypothetical protein U0359_15190 [Byssovorax sp.]
MENCANPEDEDCDGLSPPCKGNLGWAKHFGDMQGQQGRGIAVDSAGASFITGTFYGTTDFGGGVLSSAGYMDGFLLKLDPAGNHIWSRRLTGPGDQIATSVATDGSGAVFVAGTFSGTIDLGNGPMASGGGIDIFVARFDVNGSCLWSKRFGDAADQLIDGVAVDPTSNDVIIAGHFYGKVDFGGGPLANVGGANVFVAKLDMNGGHVWSRSSHGSGDQLAGGVAVDGMGNVLTTGTFYGSVDFGGGLLVSQGGADVFVVKTSAGGDHLWSKRFGDAGDQAGTSIAPDSAAGIVVTGYFDGSINFGASTLTSGGSTDIFVTKLDKDGGHLWSKRFGDAGSQPDSVVAVDKMDNVVITGAFASAVNFGDGPHASAGSYDIFLAKLDAAGNNVWGKSFGDKLAQGAYGIAVDGGENILITGSMAGKVDFGDGAPVASAGGDDVFVAKFGP